jgi:hypothetical protein
LGYAGLLEALEDPKHERHAGLTELTRDEFDPDDDEAEWLVTEVASLAKSCSRRSNNRTGRRR